MQNSVRGQNTTNVAASKVKLPTFWEKDTAAWFDLVEDILVENRIVDARAKYRAVLLHIPQHLVERARGVINAAGAAIDPYEELKERLVELLTPSKLDQVNSIIWAPELGGRRPSEMMDSMLAALPPGETAGYLFKGMFLHKLPSDMKDMVAVQFDTLQAKDLAAYADTIWNARNAKKTTVAAVTATDGEVKAAAGEESALEKAVAALALQKQPRKGGRGGRYRGRGCGGRNGGQDGGRSGGQNGNQDGGQNKQRGSYLCCRHLRWGDQAWSCEEPQACQFSEN